MLLTIKRATLVQMLDKNIFSKMKAFGTLTSDAFRTAFSSLRRSTVGKLHLHLLNRVSWYSKWHRHPHHRKVHYSALALTCLLVVSSIITTLFPNPSGVEAAVATWDFTHDNTKYDYDSSKVSMAGGNASLTNPGSATGASTNINAGSGTTTNASAQFASANKEYLTIPSNSSLQTGDIDFEIGGWVRFDSVGSLTTLFNKWRSNNGKLEYLLQKLANDKIAFYIRKADNSGTVGVTSTSSVSVNNWYNIRAYHDSINDVIGLRINNTTLETSAVSGGAYISDVPLFMGGGDGTSTGPIMGNTYLNGRLDSWYFQKRISTTNEATALYNAGSGRTYNDLTSANGLDTFKTGLTSWWDFNEEGGTRYDSKGTNHLTSAADPIIAPPVYGSELIVNPGFETAGAGGADVFGTWVETTGDGALSDETTIVHSGSHAAKLTKGTTSSAYVSESLALTAGQSYYLSFWSRGDGTNAGRYNVYDNTQGAFIVTTVSTNNITTSYQLFTVQFTVPAGCSSAGINLYSPVTTGGIAYFDDVSVKQITTASINNGGFDLRPATGGEKTNVSTVSRSRTSNVATMVATAHGLKNQDVVTITGMTDTTFNGTGKAVTVVDVDTFTYASTGTDAGSAADTGGRIATDVFSSWTESVGSIPTINAETTAPYFGAYALRMDIDAGNGGAYPTIVAPIIGKKYSWSLYSKASSACSLIVQDSASLSQTTVTLTTSYAQYTGTMTPTTTSFQLLRGTNAASKSIYIDQVTLTSLGPTAEAGIAAGNAIDGNFGAGFNGSGQYLSKASNESLQAGTSNFSVWGWAYIDKKSTTNQYIVSKYSTAGAREFGILWVSSDDIFRFVTSPDGTATSYVISTVPSPVLSNQYNFVRCWYDGVKIYIQVNNGTTYSANYSTGIYAGSATFNIGSISNPDNYLAGRIDGVGFAKRVLTTDEATALYNNGKGLKYASLPDSIKNDSALKGYWNLDEKGGTRYDSTSNGNDLTDNGTVTQVQGVNYYEGTVGTVFDASGSNNNFSQTTLSKRPTYCSICLNNKPAMLFDGVDDGLMATGDKIGTGDVTVTAVINVRGWGGGTLGRIIEVPGGFYIATMSTSSRLNVNTGSTDLVSATSSIALNTSYIVTVTRKSDGKVSIYINGALSGSANQASGTPVAGSDTYIGNRAAGDRAFDGNIGTVQIHNGILDPLHRNNLEKTLGAKYGITVATDAASLSSSASSSLYPTLSLNTPLQYATISSFTPTLAGSSTGTPRYQLTTDSTSTPGSGNSASYYYHNGTNWVSANKYNAYQSNTASEINTNIATLKTDVPTEGGNYLKWRAFLITDGIDSLALTSINSNYISDTKAPTNPTTLTASILPMNPGEALPSPLPSQQTIGTDEWHNSNTLHLTWPNSRNANDPETDQNRGGAIDQINENEIYSGVSSYNLYFGEDPSADPTTTSGLINANSSPYNQAATSLDLTNLPLETGKTYYFLIETKDVAGNIAHINQRAAEEPPVLDTPLLAYKYDSTLPTPIEYVQVAQVGCSTSPTFDLTWPASTDSLSGLKYYQYKVGVNGTINTTTNTTVTVAPERENENVFYVRPVDNANNSNPTLGSTIWQSTVFCSTQSVTLTSGPTYTKTLSTLTVDFETSRPTTSKVEVYKIKEDESLEKVSTGEDTTLSLTHSVIVPNLTPDTNYKYKLFFKDQNNNEGESNYYEASTDLISLSHTTTNNLEDSLSSLTIIFETTKPAKARVEVYKDTNKQQEVSVQDYTLNHHLTINNLTSGTTYTYKIFYIDQENNNYESSTYTTTTTTVGIVDLPTITSGPNSVNVTWKTNLPTTGQVQIKEGDTYKEPQGHITFLTDHNVTIQGLKSEKPYKLRIIWTDQSNKTDQTGWFDANTAQSPMVHDLRVEVISPNSTLVSWQTNYAAQCDLLYGTSDKMEKVSLSGVATDFSRKLEGLTGGSLYQNKINCYTADGVEFFGGISSQTPPLPAISALRFEPLKDSSHATYKAFWTTNIETSSAIYYKVKGVGGEYKSKASAELVKEHEILLDSMEDQSSYELFAQGADKYGNVTKSDVNTITTPNDSRPPKITNLSTSVKSSGFADNQKAQVIVSWDTDELTTSQVEYANGIEGTEYQNRTKEETALSTSHVVVISDLEPSKIYHLRAISKDQANNPAYSQDTTVITGKVQKSVLDIILASLQRSLGWITKLFK